MATFVLCAGGFTGGWVWREIGVDTALRDAGHLVFTPTYTGVGERVHLTSRDVDLHTHVNDVLMVLEYEDLTAVVLVGWSYGGMVVAAVAAQAPDRIGHLVALDGYIPDDGQSIADIVGADVTAMYEQNARSHGDGWLLHPDWDEPDPRSTTHPLATIHTPVTIENPAAASIPRTFIFCTEDKHDDPFLRFTIDHSKKAKAHPAWDHHEIHTDHGLSDTSELVDILLDVAAAMSRGRASGHRAPARPWTAEQARSSESR